MDELNKQLKTRSDEIETLQAKLGKLKKEYDHLLHEKREHIKKYHDYVTRVGRCHKSVQYFTTIAVFLDPKAGDKYLEMDDENNTYRVERFKSHELCYAELDMVE